MAVTPSRKPCVSKPKHTRWVVYHYIKFTTRSFASKSAAINWLGNDAGALFIPVPPDSPLAASGIDVVFRGIPNKINWSGPVPVVRVGGRRRKSNSPMLLAGFGLPDDTPKSNSEIVSQKLEDLLGDDRFNPTLLAARTLGFLDNPNASDNAPEQGLSDAQISEVNELAKKWMPPDITCALEDEWCIAEILATARCLPVHSQAVRTKNNLEELRDAGCYNWRIANSKSGDEKSARNHRSLRRERVRGRHKASGQYVPPEPLRCLRRTHGVPGGRENPGLLRLREAGLKLVLIVTRTRLPTEQVLYRRRDRAFPGALP